jgi:hypothetical protein
MSTKRHKPEEIVTKLRQVEVLTAQGQTVAEAIRSIGGDGGDVLSLAAGICWAEGRSGETSEGVGG